MSYDEAHVHDFVQTDEVTLVCRDEKCGTHWAPRIRLTHATSNALLIAIDERLQVLWSERSDLKSAGESVNEQNHQMTQLGRIKKQVHETQRRFGWVTDDSSSET